MTNLLLMIVVLFSGERCFAAPLEDVLKAPHNDPGYFSVVISLLFVICLIYATGIIYNKLNNLGVKAVKAQNKNFDNDKITIISTTPLGANRTLHVVELNGKKMLIGASANSIHLIKDLSENTGVIEECKESFPSENQLEDEVLQAQEVSDEEEFGLYKKYLR